MWRGTSFTAVTVIVLIQTMQQQGLVCRSLWNTDVLEEVGQLALCYCQPLDMLYRDCSPATMVAFALHIFSRSSELVFPCQIMIRVPMTLATLSCSHFKPKKYILKNNID